MKVTATRLSATGGYGLGVQYLQESVEFFSRASVTDEQAKYDLNQLAIGAKELGIWNDLVIIPCASHMGGLHQFGGAAQRTNTPWTITNGTLTAKGAEISMPSWKAGYIRSNQNFENNGVAAPMGLFNFASHSTTPETVQQVVPLARLQGDWKHYVASFSYGAWPMWHLRVFANQTMAHVVDGERGNNYKIPMLGGASFNGTATASILVEGTLGSLTHVSTLAMPTGKMEFFPALRDDFYGSSGTIHCCGFYYGNYATLGISVWRKFKALVGQTILARHHANGNHYILSCGQSNRVLQTHATKTWAGECPFEFLTTGLGGVSIQEWTGNLANTTRTARYKLDFWDNAVPTQFQLRRVNQGRKREVLYWFQGESDHGTQVGSLEYQAQLTKLINWFREDTQNPDLTVVVVQMDASRTLRQQNSGGYSCNFTTSGFVGGLTGANGAWTMDTLTTELTPYVWRRAGYIIEEQANKWVLIETTGSTVVASAVQSNIPHPAMVTSWVDATNAPITPAFTWTRTQGIEQVRYTQRTLGNDIANVHTFDSRGYARADNTHIDDPLSFARDLNNYLLSLP